LIGRADECRQIDRLVEGARGGHSGVLVVRGEAGIGKSALLEYAVASASGFQVLRAIGVESEMELPFAGLHQLYARMLERLALLPQPQQDAMRTALGLATGGPPDRFLIGLGLLGLLADTSEKAPLLCVVDDAQWLDEASTQALAFAARRLFAEQVCVVLGTRSVPDELTGFPQLAVQGLSDRDAGALLASVLSAPLDERVRHRVIAEAHGNPLALLEWPHGLTAAELGSGLSTPDLPPLTSRIEEGYRQRVADLPRPTRRFLTLAAAEPTGDALLVWRAALRLGVEGDAAPAIEAGLIEVGATVQFRHPTVRAAAYRAASIDERRDAHWALADATDASVDPDRRAWHLALAADGPDEDVAVELERCAARAQARGGLAAAAAFLKRAVALSSDPARRAPRALAAAQASLEAGAFDEALGLLSMAKEETLDEVQTATAELLRGEIAFAGNMGSAAPPLLLQAAKSFEPLDVVVARETYLDAWGAALFAGRLATDGGLLKVSRAARAAPPPAGSQRPSDLLLDSLAILVSEGLEPSAQLLREATRGFLDPPSPAQPNFRWGWLTTIPSNVLWDEDSWHAINARQLQEARDAGALARLPIDLTAWAVLVAWRGDFEAAAVAIAEAESVTEATGTRFGPYAALLLAALRGREVDAVPMIESVVRDASAEGQGIAVQWAEWVNAILSNGLGRHDEALASAQHAAEEMPHLFVSAWALPELIEAAVRSERTEVADDALEHLTGVTSTAGTAWGLGIQARSRALVCEGEVADGLYLEAIDLLGSTRLRPELARAHLLYGEWLRREKRRVDARMHLRAAYDELNAIGMEAFAERARRELAATGETVRNRSIPTILDLTPQETQIAEMAGEGRTNREIGTQLFISAHTVEYHLKKVFTKLDVTSRTQLREGLARRSGR
jgi:DNA-binding CsgD family transcriptional regulator/tetratricopeptide (TPR) repeat protein